MSDIETLATGDVENITSPHEDIVDGSARYNASMSPLYTEKSWTAAGTYEWEVPENVNKVKVAVCGGGSGAVVLTLRGGTLSSDAGGTSSFGNLISAQGAGAVNAAARTSLSGYQWSTGSWGGGYVRWDSPYARRGTAIAGDHVTAQNGATGWALGFNSATGSYGAGGYAYTGNPDYNNIAASGSAGMYATGTFNVTPGQKIKVVVGAGGIGRKYAPDTSGGNYNTGGVGFVLIAYGEGVE